MGIANYSPLCASKGYVHDRALPRHPHSQGTYGVQAFLGVESDAALAGAARIVVLDAEAPEDTNRAVVHVDRDRESVFPEWVPEELANALLEVQEISDMVKLRLGHFE